MDQDGHIDLEDLPKRFKEKERIVFKSKSLQEIEKDAISECVLHFGMTKSGVESITGQLGISRATLYRKIKEYNVVSK